MFQRSDILTDIFFKTVGEFLFNNIACSACQDCNVSTTYEQEKTYLHMRLPGAIQIWQEDRENHCKACCLLCTVLFTSFRIKLCSATYIVQLLNKYKTVVIVKKQNKKNETLRKNLKGKNADSKTYAALTVESPDLFL